MGLAQIGEFSFIIAALGLSLNVTSDFIYPIAVAVSSLTTLLTPYLIKSSDSLVEWFDRVAPKPLLQAIDAYSERVGNIEKQRIAAWSARSSANWAAQIALNLLIIAGIFIARCLPAQANIGLVARISRRRGWNESRDMAGGLAGELSVARRRVAQGGGRSDARRGNRRRSRQGRFQGIRPSRP